MDAGSAPERIGKAHLPDQSPNFRRHARPAGTPTRFPAPERAKASPMPAHNRLRPHNCHRIQDGRRKPVQQDENERSDILRTGRFVALRHSTLS